MLHTHVNSLLKTKQRLYICVTAIQKWLLVVSWRYDEATEVNRYEAPHNYSIRLVVRVPLFQLCIKLSPYRWWRGNGEWRRGLDRKCSTERRPQQLEKVSWWTFTWGICLKYISSLQMHWRYNTFVLNVVEGVWIKSLFQYENNLIYSTIRHLCTKT